MNKLILLIVLIPCLTQAQDITGQWNGILSVQGMELRLVFHVSRDDSAYTTKMDSPDQKAFGIPASATNFENSTLTIEITKVGVRYQGQYGPNGIEGNFYQSGQSFPVNLTRNLIEKKVLFRPQEPKPPYPYHSEEVRFPSEGGNIELAGTLTLPDGEKKFPTAILITGSGSQNRDEEFMTHKPFLVLADHLRYFLTYDPVSSLKRIKCPVLTLNGEKDVQVAPENLVVIEKAIRHGGNDNVTVKEFSAMNHLFQTCKTGAMDEYATIEQAIDPLVLEEISGWVLKQTR